ncbi:D-lactate dehydrogenase, partial [Neisseria sp. P0017.S005]
AFDIAAVYGKDTFYLLKTFGTHQLPKLLDVKARVDRFSKNISFLPKHFSDKLMQLISKILPDHLPKTMRNYRDKYEHHQ